MQTHDIRSAFLAFFEEHGHTQVPSASLVPADDPTLLFTNAGMAPFKEVFLGQSTRPYQQAVSAQRCVRAGGKHNDLDNVGKTTRHHTYFEMLGNFSFGAYGKATALRLAWTFLTERMGLDPSRLWVTVHHDDDETASLWLDTIGVPSDRLSRCGDADNFWRMGETGPCGPCTELFYDHGPDVPGGPPGSPTEHEGERYVEIWNLVFMQYEAQADGRLVPLPNLAVDTGMGLERMASVMQGVRDNFDTDTFQALKQAIVPAFPHPPREVTWRVVADHLRATVALMADGVRPGSEGRSYVLRRIMRRAMRYVHQDGLQDVRLDRWVGDVVRLMAPSFEGLVSKQATLERWVRAEAELFGQTLARGMTHLDEALATCGDALPGATVFQLYDTYGFPADMTADMLSERGIRMDWAGYEQAMAAQREQSRAQSRFKMAERPNVDGLPAVTFTGYEGLEDQGVVLGLWQDGVSVDRLDVGQEAWVVLDRTPFYAERGGQVGDVGCLTWEGPQGDGMRFDVDDTQPQGDQTLHWGRCVTGSLQVGQRVHAGVDSRRHDIARNHSATHLLHAALRACLGEEVVQQGSWVAHDRLRFDVTSPRALTADDLERVEQWVNACVAANHPVVTTCMAKEEAVAQGAMALFSEAYGDTVRVLTMGPSVELCGGTHVASTGEVGSFKVVSEASVSAGVRRIEAVTGRYAWDVIHHQARLLQRVRDALKTSEEGVVEAVVALQNELAGLQRTQQANQQRAAHQAGQALQAQMEVVGERHVLCHVVTAESREHLRWQMDACREGRPHHAMLLAAPASDGATCWLLSAADPASSVDAPQLLRHVATALEGRGGGRPTLAQGGGRCLEGWESVVTNAQAWLVQALNETA